MEDLDTLAETPELPEPPGFFRRHALLLAGIAFVTATMGGLPWALGFGPFGARMLLGEAIVVHVMNTSGQDLIVEVPFSSPKTVVAGTVQELGTLSGPIAITSRSTDGALLERIETDARGDLFYNALGGGCLAVFDLSEIYGDRGGTIRVVERMTRDDRLHAIEATTFLLPRRVVPDTAVVPVHWIDTVGCNLLEPEEEPILIGQAEVRLASRREAAAERKRASP